MIFQWICGGESGLPSYSSAILVPSLRDWVFTDIVSLSIFLHHSFLVTEEFLWLILWLSKGFPFLDIHQVWLKFWPCLKCQRFNVPRRCFKQITSGKLVDKYPSIPALYVGWLWSMFYTVCQNSPKKLSSFAVVVSCLINAPFIDYLLISLMAV